MSFTAVWSMGDVADEMTVQTAEDVDALLVKLADPAAGPAVVEHQDRELMDDTEGLLGEPGETRIPDHDVAVAVHDGFGYLTYADPDHDYATLKGESSSPQYSTDYVDYPEGSGVPVEVLAKALKEFLRTAQRPTNVTWQAA